MTKPDNPAGPGVAVDDLDEARRFLAENMGFYCSYCSVRCSTIVDVEHIHPRRSASDRTYDWDNLLLSCRSCNDTKRHRDEHLCVDDYYWPHLDNTVRAFVVESEGMLAVSPALTPEQQVRARRTLRLTGLDRHPASSPPATPSDRRWSQRRDAWKLAHRKRQQLAQQDTQEFRETIAELASKDGHWLVWLTVFYDDPDMRQRLLAQTAFPGTWPCFDDRGQLRERRAEGL